MWTERQFDQLMLMTKNSYKCIVKADLEEIRQNPLDQLLGFSYLLAKFIRLAQVGNPLALEAKFELLSHFTNLPNATEEILTTFSIKVYLMIIIRKLAQS